MPATWECEDGLDEERWEREMSRTPHTDRAAFVPRKGAVRRFTCGACGQVAIERWHGAGAAEFTVGLEGGGEYDPRCPAHPAGLARGFHTPSVEVLA